MPKIWTDEERAAQRERCLQTKPWEHSTGPRTKRGKNKVRFNARKPATEAMLWRAYMRDDYAEAARIRRRMRAHEQAKRAAGSNSLRFPK